MVLVLEVEVAPMFHEDMAAFNTWQNWLLVSEALRRQRQGRIIPPYHTLIWHAFSAMAILGPWFYNIRPYYTSPWLG
jgi:hypothetical protein